VGYLAVTPDWPAMSLLILMCQKLTAPIKLHALSWNILTIINAIIQNVLN